MPRSRLPSPARIVANLPYSVATPLLIALAEDRALAALVRSARADVPARSGRPHRGHARRQGLRAAGRAVAVAHARLASCFTIPAEAFTPRPKVDSALVEFVPRETPTPACDVSRVGARHRRGLRPEAQDAALVAAPDRARQRGVCSQRSASTLKHAPRSSAVGGFLPHRQRACGGARAKARSAISARNP